MINVQVNIGNIRGKVEKATRYGQFITSQQVLKDCNYYIPKDKGTLERSSLQASDLERGEIVWDTPYARRLYYHPEYNFSKDKNPHARGLWFDEAKAVRGDKWVAVAQEGVEQGLDRE
ncbi:MULTISPECIES: minor capsid protein [Heyndrickxia]|uniref:Minor capsid protein n=1 Tax=Heyndrickxia coagulans DSM 1 = ATCC 7050 TaxID=1121088 RepID=A0A0B5WXH6_HEYCO|nr:minor capsid protein [Heyndrickxia coagulans]AJH78126.1 minor capsid family protein [Heyndrickxia coagulans DSM 1 = ATCC 7050]AJH79301.1 minor capsid family protein [Heyndrickxia coagulans DSM 1 = ATCC 7050]AWP37772.1 minor capsid protein [Heyndrickxia coagulans]MCR2847675.1 minor capsid protein [Heyndrickxia coagulans]MDR4225301.1 minor capsid protein [Heyndrickxia coagulans DSM 1 = ATCC 7050]